MSFILDALRKSENERQRGSVPDVARIPLAHPEQRMPRWAITLIAFLAVCTVALAAAWWQSQRNGLGRAPASSPVATVAPSAETSGAVAVPERAVAELPEGPAPRERARTAPAPTIERRAVTAPAVVETPPEPETEAPPARRASGPPPPTLAQVRAEGVDVPALQLQLHSFSGSRGSRFVFINGARYGEGESLDSGPRVVQITATGVVLEHEGREFLLTLD